MKLLKRAETLMVFLLFFISNLSQAQKTDFYYSPVCLEAARQISMLRLKPAAALLIQEKVNHPENAAIDYLENYIDFYTLITSQDIDELHILERKKQFRLDRLNRLPSNSPYRLYGQAEINLQWAFSRVFHQEYLGAALEFRESYKLLEHNTELFPFFTPNFKNTGMLNALLGSIPDNLHWILNIIGMKGDFDQGLSLLMNFTEHQSFTPDQLLEKQSGEYYYILMQMNFGDKQLSWNFCERTTRDYEINLLSTYLRAFVGIKTGHNEFAIEALNLRPQSIEYATFPFLDYVHGVAFLNKLNDHAAIYLKKFVTFNKGKNMIKDAYKRLSWHYLIQGDQEKFLIYQGMIQKYGISNSEEDKLALRESVSGFKPNIGLLKSRLLFDGGYMDKALIEIQKSYPINPYEKSEMEYRYGRIFYEQKQYLKAIDHFLLCIQRTDPELHLYFPPASCNQLGVIYEILGNKGKSIEYYKKTLTYKGYDYKYSTIIKARHAINRLTN